MNLAYHAPSEKERAAARNLADVEGEIWAVRDEIIDARYDKFIDAEKSQTAINAMVRAVGAVRMHWLEVTGCLDEAMKAVDGTRFVDEIQHIKERLNPEILTDADRQEIIKVLKGE